MNPVVFLVGLHGSGKSTIGRHLAAHHGWRQLSLGDLGRLARKGKRPSDISLRLMVCMAAFRPGQDLPEMTTQAIVGEVIKHRSCSPVVCDGFPVTPEHLRRLPPGAIVIEVACSNETRETRLIEREAQTLRKWKPGAPSLRDAALPSLRDSAAHAGIPYLLLDNTQAGAGGLEGVSNAIRKACDSVS